jgi:RNA polymerase sigma-70 factor (ECF subfamily)
MWRLRGRRALPSVNQIDDHERLTAIYDQHAHRVYAYALRHCGRNRADDVLAETFAIAWRRRDQVPDDPVGWLLVTARNVISGARRAEHRRLRLTALLAEQPTGHHSSAGEVAQHRQELLQALDRLSQREREALLLVAWDGLDSRQAALVAGCTQRAFRARLARARARLTAELLQPDDSDTLTNHPSKGLSNEPRSATA